jgi:hypothetical protein
MTIQCRNRKGQNLLRDVRIEVLTIVTLGSDCVEVVTPSIQIYLYRRLGGPTELYEGISGIKIIL